MERKERTCAVCRQNYKFCPHCNEDKNKPLWLLTFCSSNCKNIYDVTSQFEDNRIGINEAKTQLDKLDLSKLSSFGESYKSTISKINASTAIIDKTDDITEVEVLENDIVIQNDANIISEKEVETTEEVVKKEEKVFKKPRNKRAKIDVEE